MLTHLLSLVFALFSSQSFFEITKPLLTMAGKIMNMSQIKQLIRLYQQGVSIRKIAQALGMSRNTTKVYLQKIDIGNWDLNDLLQMDDSALEKCFHAGNPAYTDDRFEVLKPQLEYFLKELSRADHRVTRILLWEEYKVKNPNGYEYTQSCYHLDQHLKAKNPSMVLTHIPGEKLFIDFAGKTYFYTDLQTGNKVFNQLFIATLPYSDYGFVIAVPSQKIADFLFALEQCLLFLGGVPELFVPDNLKSAVIKASRYEPILNDAFNQFANHYGAGILPARVASPKDKALVENHVNMCYQRVLAPLRNRMIYSIKELNEALSEQNQKVNQRRMQVKDFSREEAFLSTEKMTLNPLPDSRFILEHQHIATVQKNNHVSLSEDKHYYSVPYQYIGKQAKLIYDRAKVVIYVDNTQVAVHVRNCSPGKYSTIKDHLCSTHRHYSDRSPEYYIEIAARRSEVLKNYFEFIFEGATHAEHKYRTCDGILRLYQTHKHEKENFDLACQTAIDNNVRSYHFVKNMLENKTCQNLQASAPTKPLPEHENIRGLQYFLQFFKPNSTPTK